MKDKSTLMKYLPDSLLCQYAAKETNSIEVVPKCILP